MAPDRLTATNVAMLDTEPSHRSHLDREAVAFPHSVDDRKEYNGNLCFGTELAPGFEDSEVNGAMTGVISDAVNPLWLIILKNFLAFVIAIRLVSDGAAATGVDIDCTFSGFG